jgi:hypothetical protein
MMQFHGSVAGNERVFAKFCWHEMSVVRASNFTKHNKYIYIRYANHKISKVVFSVHNNTITID